MVGVALLEYYTIKLGPDDFYFSYGKINFSVFTSFVGKFLSVV